MTECEVYYTNDHIVLNDSKNQPNTNTFITKIILFVQKFAGFFCHNKAVITQSCYKSTKEGGTTIERGLLLYSIVAALFDVGLIVRHMWRIFVKQVVFLYKVIVFGWIVVRIVDSRHQHSLSSP